MSIGDEKFDNVLLALAGQHREGVPELMHTIASFLRRKTDFFTGASQAEWENLLLGTFRAEAKIATAEYAEKLKGLMAADERRRQKVEEEREILTARQKELNENKIMDVTDDEAAQIIKEEEEK